MKRWPLSRKIVGLALLNLALLGALAAAVAVSQFQMAPESLLLGPSRDRLEAIASNFSNDYAAAPEQARDGLLAAYGRRYHAEAFVVEPRGNILAGPDIALPRELLNHMRRIMPPPNQFGGPPPLPGEPPPPRPHRPDLPPESVFLAITPQGYWAGARILQPQDGRGRFAVLLLRSNSLLNSALFFDWRLLGLTALAVIAITAICWLPFVRSLTHSIAEMDRVTEQMAQGHFETKVAVNRADELGHLAAQVNCLAARLQSFVKNQKRFLGDTAHELCAPIARIQFALGILEQRVEDPALPHVAALHDEIQEMSALVNELLSFSKAGWNAEDVPLAPIDLAALAERAVARESRSDLRFEIAVPAGLQAVANESCLSRALSNLLRNAARYAGQAGPISIAAAERNGHVSLTVSDCGAGLPESELEEVFAPFYRPEASRTREAGGAGLGLAIVKTCVEACRGTVACRNRQPTGLEVTIRLQSA